MAFCRNCGNAIGANDKFCGKCGQPVPQQTQAASLPRTGQSAERPVPKRSSPQVEPKKSSPQIAPETRKAPAEPVRQERSLPVPEPPAPTAPEAAEKIKTAVTGAAVKAAETFGETELGVFSEAAEAAQETLQTAAAPIAGIFKGIGSYIGGIFGIFRSPLSLIGALLIGAVWYFLSIGEAPDKDTAEILSFLTFAQGGLDREGLGVVAGYLGKGTVAAALISVLNGGILRIFGGIGALFHTKGEKRSFIAGVFGLILGAGAYLLFVGTENAEAGTAMAGISLAVLTLEAMGAKDGRLYTLAQSLTSKAADGVRTAANGRADSLLSGVALGSAAAAIFFAVR